MAMTPELSASFYADPTRSPIDPDIPIYQPAILIFHLSPLLPSQPLEPDTDTDMATQTINGVKEYCYDFILLDRTKLVLVFGTGQGYSNKQSNLQF